MKINCTAEITISVGDADGPVLSDGEVTPSSCGASDGEILNVTTTGGAAPLEYSWANDDGVDFGTTIDLTGAPADDYILTVIDANGCSGSLAFTISDLAAPELADGTIIGASCGNADGGIEAITITGGTGMIQYSWEDDAGTEIATTADLTSVAAGDYTLIITDDSGCTDELTFTIPDADGPVLADGTPQNASCGEANGAITGITTTGGAGSPTYQWQESGTDISGATTADLTGVDAGNYTLIVTDGNGCTDELDFAIVNEQGPVLDNGLGTDASCGEANGSILGITTTGGTGTVTYSWTQDGNPIPDNTAELNGIDEGEYELTATDDNGCTDIISFIIAAQPGPALSDGTPANSICTDDNGSITGVVTTGGTGDLTYSWMETGGGHGR